MTFAGAFDAMAAVMNAIAIEHGQYRDTLVSGKLNPTRSPAQ